MEYQPIPLFLAGGLHRHGSLVGYSPWVTKSQTWVNTHTTQHTLNPNISWCPISIFVAVTKSCLTLCDPMDCSKQAPLSFTISWNLLTRIRAYSPLPYLIWALTSYIRTVNTTSDEAFVIFLRLKSLFWKSLLFAWGINKHNHGEVIHQQKMSMQGYNFQKKEREGGKSMDYHLNQTLHFADKETESPRGYT